MASIELKSISGKGIKSLSHLPFQKPSLYTVISLTNVKKKTTVDKSNGENPVWDQPIRIDIDTSHNQDLILEFDLKAEALLSDRVVGRAFIPVANLDFSGAVQHVSYQVKTPERKANGFINFSYKVDGPGTATSQQIVPGSTPAVDYSPPAESLYPATAYPPQPEPPQPEAAYPPQPEAASCYYPTVDPVVAYPPPGMADSGIYPPPQSSTLDPPDVGGYYPPPAYPPQPECCCQEIPQPAPAWYDPSAQHPAPGGYYPPPPPPPDVYGYRQQGWDRGLCGYN